MIRARPGDLAPGWMVAGLPVLVRLGRQLRARGVRQVTLVGLPESEAAGWAALLEQGAPGLSVAWSSNVEAGSRPTLEACGIYDDAALDDWAQGRLAEPRFRIHSRGEAREAARWLWASIRKSLSHDGPIAYAFARPLAHPLTRLLARWGVAPNAVTLLGMAVGLAAGAAAALGGYRSGVLAAALFFAGLILDCADGDLARITITTSRLGQWLDTITDDLAYAALAAGLGIGLFRETGTPVWLWIGGVTTLLVAVGQGIIYRALRRAGGPIDTARYPWFFMGKEGLAQSEGRSLLGWLSFAVRRDALTLYFLVLGLAGWRWAMLGLLGAGALAYALLLAVDRAVRASRSPERRQGSET